MVQHGSRRRRRKPRFRRHTPPGAEPGTLAAAPGAPPPVVRVIAYGPTHVLDRVVQSVEQLAEYVGKYPVVWIDVNGLGDTQILSAIGRMFGLHALALEDVLHVHQRAKIEQYEEHLFVVARMVSAAQHVETEQMSLFLGTNYVLTFQERPGDCLDPVRIRIHKNSGRIRRLGPDYLAYALLDSVIDSYFPVVEQFADHLDNLEDEVTTGEQREISRHIHDIRNNLLVLRRSIRPHREAFNQLIRDLHPLISDETRVYLRDCYDHTVQLIELLDVYREMCVDLRDFHLSIVSNRMNEIMKVLTIIATIFIPLGFIAGVYGMNFDTRSPYNMPELHWRLGYLFALGLMSLVAGGMVLYFRRKGWVGAPRGRPGPD